MKQNTHTGGQKTRLIWMAREARALPSVSSKAVSSPWHGQAEAQVTLTSLGDEEGTCAVGQNRCTLAQ